MNLFTQDGVCIGAGSLPLAMPPRGSTHHTLLTLLSADIDAQHSFCGELHLAIRRSIAAVDAPEVAQLSRTRSLGSAGISKQGQRIAMANLYATDPNTSQNLSLVAFEDASAKGMLRFVSTVSSAGKMHWLQHGGRLHCLFCDGQSADCQHHYCIQCLGDIQDGSCDCAKLGAPVGSCSLASDGSELDPAFVQSSIEELLSSMPDVVRCPNPKCSTPFVVEPLQDLNQPAPADVLHPITGAALEAEALRHFNSHRFR